MAATGVERKGRMAGRARVDRREARCIVRQWVLDDVERWRGWFRGDYEVVCQGV